MTYEWIDPWEAIEQVEHFNSDWRQREDEHRLEMRAVALACSDATHQIRRQAEAMMEPYVTAASLRNNPPMVMRAEDYGIETRGLRMKP